MKALVGHQSLLFMTSSHENGARMFIDPVDCVYFLKDGFNERCGEPPTLPHEREVAVSALDDLLDVTDAVAAQPPAAVLDAAGRAIADTLGGMLAGVSTEPILVYERPSTPSQSKFSLQYGAAVTMLHGDYGPDRFNDAELNSPALQDMLSRVSMSFDSAISDETAASPAIITIRTKGGKTFSIKREKPVGGPDEPLSEAELKAKFSSCCRATLGPDEAERLFGLLRDLPNAEGLWTLLARPRTGRWDAPTCQRTIIPSVA